MKWLNKDEDLTDDRIVLHTMGRSVSTRVIVEQFDTGFEIKGSYEEVMKEKSQERKIEKLTERQQDIYQIIKEHKIGFMTPKDIINKEEIQYSKKDSTNTDICRRTCEQLVAKKLLSREKVTTEEGTENRYRLIQ